MRHPQNLTLLTCAITAACLLCIGCGSSSTTASAPQARTPAMAASPVSANESNVADSPEAEPVSDAAQSAIETFAPPFPDRTSLFARPNAQKAVGLMHKRHEERGGDLQLKGFVEVDRPRAMLHIEGKLWVAGEGDTRENIRVVAVAPPNVSLLRDDAKLELSLRDER